MYNQSNYDNLFLSSNALECFQKEKDVELIFNALKKTCFLTSVREMNYENYL